MDDDKVSVLVNVYVTLVLGDIDEVKEEVPKVVFVLVVDIDEVKEEVVKVVFVLVVDVDEGNKSVNFEVVSVDERTSIKLSGKTSKRKLNFQKIRKPHIICDKNRM